MGYVGKRVGKIKVPVDEIDAHVRQLRGLSDGLPSRTVVEEVAGRKGLPSASGFERRMAERARNFGESAEQIVLLLEQHAAKLRAAVEQFAEEEQDRQAFLDVLDAATERAGSPSTKVAPGQYKDGAR